MPRYAIVVTTINAPTGAVVALAEGAPTIGADLILIGDAKSPPGFNQSGAHYYDLAAQRATGFRFAADAPTGHYARKNIGYLIAMRGGADVIIETDDDNIPRSDFWDARKPIVEACAIRHHGWVNVYRYFSNANIWPRGLPLEEISVLPPARSASSAIFCPIQQGLADQKPDVDAIYRLVLPLPVDFERNVPIALMDGAWCPFNSQNTTWWREAFPLLYLPLHCSFRMTDIWRSFVAQRIAWGQWMVRVVPQRHGVPGA